jgi:hypothetical protein
LVLVNEVLKLPTGEARKVKATIIEFETKGKGFHHRPPVPPRVFNFNMPFYQEMFKDRTGSSIMVYLYSGTSWQWVTPV